MDRFCLYLGVALVLSSVAIPLAAHSYDARAHQCRALDEAVHTIDEVDLWVFQHAISEWLRYFDELGPVESKYRNVRGSVSGIQSDLLRLQRGGDSMSALEKQTEVRRIEERLRDVPYVGEELVHTTYSIVPYIGRRFLATFVVILILLAPSMVMDQLIASSERDMRYRV